MYIVLILLQMYTQIKIVKILISVQLQINNEKRHKYVALKYISRTYICRTLHSLGFGRYK